MARKMAKGTVWLMGAQISFLLGGYIIHFGLGRMLGPADYGTFGIILSLFAIVRIFLQGGVPQAVTKYVSEGRSVYWAKKNAYIIQSIVVILCFIVIFVFAPYIASLLGDISLSHYIRLMSLMIPINGIYQIYLSIINGKKLFLKVASIKIIYSFLRPVMVFAFVLLGFAVFGALSGLIIAVLFALLFSLFVMRKIEDKSTKIPIGLKEMFWFFLPLVVLSVMITSIRSLDMLFVKSLMREGRFVGYYTSAWAVSALPITVFTAISFTILPSVSSSIAKNNLDLTRSYIRNAIRYTTMILLPITLLVVANPGKLLAFFYTQEYKLGGGALRILIMGMLFFTIFFMFNTTIIAMGKPKIPMAIVLFLLPIDIILNYIFIPIYGLEGAAFTTTLISFIGMCVTACYLFKKIGGIVDSISCLRLLAASAFIFTIAIFITTSGWFLIIIYVVLLLGYIGLLWILKEIKEDDIRLLKDIFNISEKKKN